MTDEERCQAEKLAKNYKAWSPNQWRTKTEYDVERIFCDGYAAAFESLSGVVQSEERWADQYFRELNAERARAAKLIAIVKYFVLTAGDLGFANLEIAIAEYEAGK